VKKIEGEQGYGRFFFWKSKKRSQTQEKKSQIFGEKPEDRRKFVHIDLGID